MERESCRECGELKVFEKNPGGKSVSIKGLFLAGVTGGTAVILSTICFPFVTPALRRICLPYVPATTAQVHNVLKVLQWPGPKGTLVDIGSGDGRIVVAAASAGYTAHGIELNRWLVLYSRWRAYRLGLSESATFSRQDLWRSDLSPYDNVVIFGVEEMMPELEAKLGKELGKGSKVAACRFPLPNWTALTTSGEGVDSVWLYKQ